MSQRRCCECVSCEDCFESDADTACCRLSPADVLMLKIERPAWSMPVEYQQTGSGRPCKIPQLSSPMTGTINHAAAEPLLVMYRAFEPDAQNGSGVWFAENGSFGCNGGVSTDDLWLLWPPICPQQISDGGTPKPACCDNDCTCSTASNIRTYIGPADDYIGSSFVCSSIDGSANNVNLTNFQKDVIDGNASNRTITNYSNCSLCAGTSINATAICDYSGYEWLDGIYNDSVNSTARYRHFYWDGSGVTESGSQKPLAHTLVSVYHREKWYKSCEKYDGGTLSDECEQVTSWACRVPEYWIYGCAGVPIFSWEIFEMYDAGKITADEYSWFFESQYNNVPLGSGTHGPSLVKKLETTHWYHPDGSGVSILQTKDWAGITLPGETTPVAATERRVVRKDLARYARGSRTVVEHQFYHARPGGWTHACYAPPKSCGTGACSGDTWSGSEIEQQAPQITRETGCRTAGGDCDYQIYDQPFQEALTTGQSCFTAAPYPQCTTCVATTSYGGCSICGGCEDCTIQPVTTKCGGPLPYTCASDVYRASCDSIHFTHTIYYHDQTGNLDAEQCVHTNHAWLFAINEECEESSGSCGKVACPPGPVTSTPRQNTHGTSILHSLARLCGCIDTTSFCSGATATLSDSSTGPTWTCRGSTIRQPSGGNRNPGGFQKPPYDTDGCGLYLCNNSVTDPLGACCVDDGSSVECIDAVTEKQCEKCGQQAGHTSTWHGKNSCCLDDDICE